MYNLGVKKYRILLVEDDTSLGSLFKIRIEADGFEVLLCDNGEAALQSALDFKPDLILLDIMLPKVDGFEVLNNLRSNPETKDITVIVLSALGQPSDVEKAKAAGASNYLIKSEITIEDIVKAIRNQLNLSAIADQQKNK